LFCFVFQAQELKHFSFSPSNQTFARGATNLARTATSTIKPLLQRECEQHKYLPLRVKEKKAEEAAMDESDEEEATVFEARVESTAQIINLLRALGGVAGAADGVATLLLG
jgi:hypothetical protein